MAGAAGTRAFVVKGQRSLQANSQLSALNSQLTGAPSVTIAPRPLASQPSERQSGPDLNSELQYVVTLTTHKEVRAYPCRSMDSAIKLAERFIAGVTKPRPASADHSELSTLNSQPSTASVAA